MSEHNEEILKAIRTQVERLEVDDGEAMQEFLGIYVENQIEERIPEDLRRTLPELLVEEFDL